MTDAPPDDALTSAYTHCFDLLRAEDHDRWLASLYWPTEARRHAQALFAFDAEVVKVPASVSEPMLGEIRLQWWRDALGKGGAGGNPVAVALLDTVSRFNLDRERLLALIEARSFDLYDDPMPSEVALENYLRDTTAGLFEAVARVLAPGRLPPPAVDSAGRAAGLTRLLRALPFQVMAGKLFLPLDLLQAQRVAPEEVLAHEPSPALARVLAALRARARMHLGEMGVGLRDAGPGGAACLPAFLCPLALRAMEKQGANPFASPVEVSPWRRHWALWRGARRLQGINPVEIPIQMRY